MGYRTLVLLYNDRASEWGSDPELGKKIEYGMSDAMSLRTNNHKSLTDLSYGKIVQCTHADAQTLAVIDSYDMRSLAHSFYRQGETADETNIRLLREAADRFGYTLHKKPIK